MKITNVDQKVKTKTDARPQKSRIGREGHPACTYLMCQDPYMGRYGRVQMKYDRRVTESH